MFYLLYASKNILVREILKKFKKEKSKGRSNSYRLSESDHTDDQGRALLSMMTKGKPGSSLSFF